MKVEIFYKKKIFYVTNSIDYFESYIHSYLRDLQGAYKKFASLMKKSGKTVKRNGKPVMARNGGCGFTGSAIILF